MKKLLLYVMAIAFVVFGCQQNSKSADSTTTKKDGIFVHISHGTDNLHRALMGLQMAAIMSEDKAVLVYFDIKGIEIVLNDAEDFTFSHFPGSKTQIQKLLSKNVTIMACPGCLKAAGKSPADLMDGVQVADKTKFFNFTEGRILTIDY